MMRWLHLRLEAPLASFGGQAIDARGVIEDFPAQSMLTGLLANALGWTRSMSGKHQELQSRILFGAMHDHDPGMRRMTDYQTAQLGKTDKMWSTRGAPISRAGGANTYRGAHQRWREYHADLRLSVVLTLVPKAHEPLLEHVAAALDKPARPLFIGRKPCLPTTPIFRGWLDEVDVRSALEAIVPVGRECPAIWPYSAGMEGGHAAMVTDERNWTSGFHGGARRVCLGRLTGRGGRDDKHGLSAP